MTETNSLIAHLAARLRWWDWLIIAVNLATMALNLTTGNLTGAAFNLAIAVFYALTAWSMREAQFWRSTSHALIDILAEQQQPQQRP
jgi:hypothetical protein